MNAAHTTAPIYIGQHVRHSDYQGRRVTGTVCTLTVEDSALMATIALDQPIVIPAKGEFHETRIYTQHVPAHELAPFDGRDELIAEMLAALRLAYRHLNGGGDSLTPMEHAEAHRMARAAIARATGAEL